MIDMRIPSNLISCDQKKGMSKMSTCARALGKERKSGD